ncbi:MAG: beta-galactosidase trimerization domain-containing protein, partial [Oscillospiraceae bacterium]
VSHIDAFTPKWQNYLREIYAENLKKLNEVYKSSYLTFESIPMPRNPETLAPLDDKTPVSYDFMNFNNKMVGDFHKYLSSEVKKYIPAIPVHAKQMQHMFSIDWSTYRNPVLYGSDPEIFAEFSDIMGNDSWQCLEQDNYKNTRTHEKLLWYDMQRSIKEAPIYNSEDHIIYDGDQNYIPEHAKRVYTDLWQGAISGRTMSTIWLWEKTNDITSQISGSVLTRPDCIKRIGDVNLDLNRLAYEVTAFQNAKSDVGLLYSNASRAYSLAHSANVHNSYQALVENGQKVEIITEKSIKKIHDYKMLVIPEVVNLPKADLDEISTYSKNGGKIVILGNKSLLKDEKNIDHDLSIVNSIYGKANLIETQNIAHELRSPTVSELKQIMQEKLRLAKLMNTTVLDANTLNVSQNVQWQQVDYNGKKLINICNYSWDEIKNVKINIDDFLSGESINLITKEKYSGNIPLKPFEPVLLEVENPKNETSMKVEFFSNNEKTSILKEGVLSAKIRLEKIGILNEPTAKLVMVLYNKNIVSEVKTKNITLDANTQYNTEFNIELGNIEKNNINDCVVKIFLWTDFETYRPLANIRSIDSFGIS